MKLILILGLIALIAGPVLAATEDTVILTVTPSVSRSINISSTTGTFGTGLTLGTSVTICVGKIENDGNVSAKWQKRAQANSGSAGQVWTLVATEASPTKDEFRLLAVTTAPATYPDQVSDGNAIASGDLECLEGDHAPGDSGLGVTTVYQDLTEGGAVAATHYTVDNSSARFLWVSLMMPPEVTDGNRQSMTLSIQAVGP